MLARLANPLLVAAYGALAVGMAVLSLEPPYATPVWPMAAITIAGLVVLIVRTRYARAAFAAAMVLAVLSLAVGSGAESLLAVVAVFEVGVRRRALTAWLCFGVALLCGALGALALSVRTSVGPPILGLQPPMIARDTLLDWGNFAAIIAVTLLIATLLGTNVGHRRRYIGGLVANAAQQAEAARAHERERIAREMHDVIAHSLSVMIAISDGAHAAADEHPHEAKAAIGRVAETGRKTLGEVRRLLGSVRDAEESEAAEHSPQPDASHLATLVSEFVAAGLPVRLVVAGEPWTDPALGLTVYRIIQESLTNVLRHARQVQQVSVALTWTQNDVTILVEDEASFVPTARVSGRGLVGMQERVALYGGLVDAGPRDGGGWRVFARLRREGE